jgi:hypothetical protein
MNAPTCRLASLLSFLVLTACGDGHSGCVIACGPEMWSIGGTISGLAGSRLTLQNNGVSDSEQIGPAANGMYPALVAGTFAPGTAYAVTIQTQPTTPAQNCVVTNGTGTMGNANVTNVVVTCTTNPGRSCRPLRLRDKPRRQYHFGLCD